MFLTYVVVNGLPFQSLSSYVTSIHVEPPEETGEDRTVLYDVAFRPAMSLNYEVLLFR
jgi:hypothetical protein